jgi:hypothetical protein
MADGLMTTKQPAFPLADTPDVAQTESDQARRM